MSDGVTLLLLLSALLSALTGAGGPARQPQAAVAVARAIQVEEVATPAAARALARPVLAAPRLPLVLGSPGAAPAPARRATRGERRLE